VFFDWPGWFLAGLFSIQTRPFSRRLDSHTADFCKQSSARWSNHQRRTLFRPSFVRQDSNLDHRILPQ
jgi:hypothetical protein